MPATSSRIPFHVSPALREQNFGTGEGKKVIKKDNCLSLKAHYAKGLFPILYARSEKFPGGESVEDVRIRAEGFIEDVMMALRKEEQNDKDLTRTVGVVSHGIFIGELVAALVRKGGVGPQMDMKNLRGMKNTAWTKVEVGFQPVVRFLIWHFSSLTATSTQLRTMRAVSPKRIHLLKLCQLLAHQSWTILQRSLRLIGMRIYPTS